MPPVPDRERSAAARKPDSPWRRARAHWARARLEFPRPGARFAARGREPTRTARMQLRKQCLKVSDRLPVSRSAREVPLLQISSVPALRRRTIFRKVPNCFLADAGRGFARRRANGRVHGPPAALCGAGQVALDAGGSRYLGATRSSGRRMTG